MRRDGRALDGRPADRPTNFPPLPSSAVAAMLRPVSAYAALCRWYWYPEVAKGPCGAAKNRIIAPCQRISTSQLQGYFASLGGPLPGERAPLEHAGKFPCPGNEIGTAACGERVCQYV